MRQWLRRLWRENVICDEVEEPADANWEPVHSFGAEVLRCRKCGDLVLATCLSEHLATEHQQRTVAIIRLYENGDAAVTADKAMRLHPTHVRTIRTFLEQQNDLLLSEAVEEIKRTGARGQAQLLRLLATEGPVQ